MTRFTCVYWHSFLQLLYHNLLCFSQFRVSWIQASLKKAVCINTTSSFHYIPNKLSPMYHYFSPKQNIYVAQCSILSVNIWYNTKIVQFPSEAYQLTLISVYARATWFPLNSMLRRILGNDFLVFNFRSENFISYHSFLKTTFISNS